MSGRGEGGGREGSCAWCGKTLAASAPRMRLTHAKGYSESEAMRASFHLRCAREVLALCDSRQLMAKAQDLEVKAALATHAAAKAKPKAAKARKPAAAMMAAPAVAAEPAREPVELRQDARVLAARGYKPMQIAAMLRMRHADVRRSLEVGR